MTTMQAARRAKVRREVAARLEAKRQKMLADMSEDDRERFRHFDLGTMISVIRSGR